MAICYVLSDSFFEALAKDIDGGEARQIVAQLEKRKLEHKRAEEILERKTFQGTKHVRQIKIGQWRIAALYVRGIDIAEVVQLCYIYNKSQNDEPRQEVLDEIDEMAEVLFSEATGWPPSDQSEYLDAMRTKFPEL